MEDTEKWRHALVKVATIAGYDSSTWDNEAAMIEEIATDVSNKLISSVPSSDFDSLVGMRAHMKSMELLFRLDSDEVRMIGIWGPSGIGKSTIARSLFSQHSGDFQLSVFMDNIKRGYPRNLDRYGAQLQLQTKFLSLILNQKDVTIHHLGVAQDRLKDKKVLVVLDDVDHSAQLDALAKETRWFGSGSRIIVTTQDKRILNAHRINHIYEVGFPHDDEALEIFCMNAFGQKSPYDGFGNLAVEVTRLVGRLPLGLSVMGSYFKGLSKEVWERELPRLRTRLNGDIENTLKFSYDALCDEEQALFLHIACFFNGERIDKVEEFLAEKFVAVEGSLRVLAEKSLISVKSGYIKMHDLLVRLGREIVRKQSPNEPGQRQFLVDDGDIRQVLRDDTLGGRSVIAINFQPEIELNISHRAFERMSNVQFLRLHSHYFPHSNGRLSSPYILEIVNCLPREVRLLHWIKFPLTCLPSSFNPEFLVEINMSYSNLEKLWEGNKVICNLKWMDLSHSENLKELPNLSSATNLLELDLSCCSSLVELPFSTGNLTNLKNLTLKLCSSLMELPSSIGNLTNLENLDLSGCLNLVGFPFSIGNMTNLKKLFLKQAYVSTTESSYLYRRPNLVELPSSIGNMTNLENLDLFGCSSLAELPSSIGNMTNLENLDLSRCSNMVGLPSSIGNMTSIEKLNLNGCSSLVELPSSIGNLTNLIRLDLHWCSSLVELPSSIGNLRNLQVLDMLGCSKLKALPININMESLDELDLTYCSSMKSFPEISTNIRVLKINGTAIEDIPASINSWSRLERLHVSYSENLGRSQHAFNRIRDLHLNDTGIEEIAPWVKEMSCLEKLVIRGCSNLQNLSSSIGNLTNLKDLDLTECSSLVELPSSIGNLTNLKDLDLIECSSLVELPSSIGNLHNLNQLDLRGCSSLVELPYSIGNVTNLENLSIWNCSSLTELPSSIGNLHNLKELGLRGCSSLVELPSSIGNLHNLKELGLRGCSKLMALPVNINMKSLDCLDLTDCSLLKSFPEISTNIRVLNINGTAIEEIPQSIRSWSRFHIFSMSYSEKLGKSKHAFDLITDLHLSDKLIQEISPWVKYMSRLRKLIIEGCTKLVSLPQLPDSLEIIHAENCESLERLDCSFYKTEFSELSFVNCFKLNQEAIELILNTSTKGWAVFPGEKVPTYFSYRATGRSVSMKLNGLDTCFPTSLRFKACILLVSKGDVEVGAWYMPAISYCINGKVRDFSDYTGYTHHLYTLCPRSEHLFVIEFEETVTSPESVFEFRFDNEDWEIKECGLLPLESLARSC
ncbi:hypothetical protein Bca101_054452 [Brassica carinata]